MRDEAPVYYNYEHDFYALTRHEDVAAAFKDYETFSSRLGVDLSSVRSGLPTTTGRSDHLHGPARASQHAQPAEQGVHAAGDPGAAGDGHRLSSTTSASSTRTTSTRCRISPARSPWKSSPGWLVCPRIPASRFGIGSTIALHREVGQIELGEKGMQANIESAMYYYGLVQERRAEPRDDMITRLIAADIDGEDGESTSSTIIEITGFASASRRRRRGNRDQAGRQRGMPLREEPRPVAETARRPQQNPCRRRGVAALRGPVQYNVR